MRSGRRGSNAGVKAVVIAAVLVCVAAVLAVLLHPFSDRPQEDERGGSLDRDEDEGLLSWKGKKYRYNEHLSNFLFLGVDTENRAETSVGSADAGQTDAIYLLAMDRLERKVTVISVPRDTMTQIEAYSLDGSSLGKTRDHISIAYAFGDGSHESCRLTKEAVSELFYGLQIEGYCSIGLEALPVLTRSVGSVEVTVPDESLEKAYPEFRKGAQVSLTEENTETFVRYRDVSAPNSAVSRMVRQQEYIKAFGRTARERYAEDPGFVAEMYLALEPYMVTNMGKDRFVSIMDSLSQGGTDTGWTVPGEAVPGADYDEYHVDDDALYEKIIETFYVEAH